VCLLWDTATGKLLHKLPCGDTYSITSIVFTPDGKSVITAHWRNDGITFWDVASGQKQRTLRLGNRKDFNSLAISPDGKWLAVGNENNTIRIWNAATGKEL